MTAAPAIKMRNIGPKSAAWLRQVGLRTREDIATAGAVEAFMRVKRAGFRPSLNLLYALEGALADCHWQEVPEARRQLLVAEYEAAAALLPAPRGRPAASPVTTTHHEQQDHEASPGFDLFDSPGEDSGERED
jgi:TfoX/Sxy family transcriptional regulator of competence genes